jgi:type II secretion system protein N
VTERRKKLLKWLGYPALAMASFVFALHFTFPYERVKERAIDAMSKEFDVGIAELGPGWLPGRISIQGLSLTTRPKRIDEKARTLFIERIDVALGLLALITKTVSVDVDATVGGGRLIGNLRQSDGGFGVDVRTEEVSLESIPGLEAVTFGAPLVGPFQAKIKLNVPKGKWANASGDVSLSCSGCTAGDGVTKVRMQSSRPQDAFANEGVTLPRIRLGEFNAKIQISKGIACIETFEAKGGDLEISVEGGVKFQDPFKDSQSQLMARLKVSEEFRRSSTRNAVMFSGVRDSEGYMNYTTRGGFLAMRWLPIDPSRGSTYTPLPECRGAAAPAKGSGARATAPTNPEPSAPPPPQPTPEARPVETAPAPPPPPPQPEPAAPPPQPEPSAPPPQPAPQPEATPSPPPAPAPAPTEVTPSPEPPPPQPQPQAPTPATGETPTQ